MKKCITVWKDGSYKIWRVRDAEYAADDPDWLTNIEFPEPEKEIQYVHCQDGDNFGGTGEMLMSTGSYYP